MISQAQRVAIRRDFGPGTVPALLLDELEAVEAAARAQFAETSELRRSNDELVARIHAAVLDVHRVLDDLL
jgi:hypothetical protein